MRGQGTVAVLLSLPLAACGADDAQSPQKPSQAEVADQVAGLWKRVTSRAVARVSTVLFQCARQHR